MCQNDIAVVIMCELKMSCYQFVDKYAQANTKNQKDEVLDEATECLEIQEEKRTQELYDFIDDFVNSQEYADYINDKRSIVKRTKATQYDINDIIVEYKRLDEVEKYPLTREQKKMYAFKRHFEKYTEKKQRALEMKKQEHSIQMIRAKIHEARKIFECTWELKEQEKEKYDKHIMHKYLVKYGIELSRLSESAELKLLEKFKKCHQVLTSRRKRREQNVYKIIEKLVSEYKLKKGILASQDKVYQYRFKPREKIIEGMEIVGTKIELIDRKKIVEAEEPKSEKSEEKILMKTETKPSKKKRAAEDKKKKGKPTKKEKKSGSKKAHKEKKAKEKKKKPDYKLHLPVFPVVNPREKIIPENIDRMVDIIEEFREFDSAMENRDIWHVQNNYILGDSGLKSKPGKILFQNFDEGKSYNRRIVLSNVSTQPRKIRFLKFVFPDDYDEIAFEVEQFGIKKLFTGCSVKFSINFQPYDTFKSYEGKVVFLSYDIHLCQYFQYEMTIKCIPKYSDLNIYPEVVRFGGLPIWRCGNYKHFKVIKFQNKGAKRCTIYIKKQLDPLELETILDEENKENVVPVPENSSTTLQEVYDILDECLKNIDNNFQFEESFFSLDENEEKRIKVFFKNASYIGNYFEKYIVDVYEDFGYDTLEPSGCQTISLYAETAGHFLTSEPEVLDFGTCVLNSCYQLNFEVYNGSSSSQAVSVRVPSNLVALVQSDVSMIYLTPNSRRTVYLKLTPRDIVFRNSCSYFDKNSSILEFPIHLQVVSKIAHQSYPPVKVHVYAILANFEDLTISCRVTSNLTNFLNTLLFDMGDCSIYETIWAEIYLTNNTNVTQFCGFLDLPQAVVLKPNFGFCKLYPGQRKKFKLYLSPEIKDFPSFAVGSLRHSNFFLKIRVETIFSLGQLDQKQKGSKIQKSSLELMTKTLTMHDTDLFSSMSRFVSELSEQMHSPATESMINKETFMASRMCSLIPDREASNPDSLDESEDKSSNKENGMGDLDTVLNYQNFLIVETNSRREIWCKANLRRPLLEFSHQSVEFPDTPCGSSSIMQISLQALEKEMEKVCHKKVSSPLEYTAYFQIWGDSCEFSVEPSCGTLKAGETITITLLAKPNVPLGIVEQTAKSIKYSEIYEMKLKEYEMNTQNRSRKGKRDKKDKGKKKSDKSTESKNKSKTDKSKKSGGADHKKKADKIHNKEKTPISSRPDTGPNITITDKELECDYLDLYPAEMVYWRSLEPYYIKASFTCIIDYAHDLQKTHKKRDRLFLEAICKVIRPDFSLDLNQQRLDFGKCLIGMITRKNIMLRNITYDNIRPKVSLLNPHGCFSVSHLPDAPLPPEHSLRLPIQFRPTSTEKVTEYFEIRSNQTVIPLILCGEGTPPVINVSPHFQVFRLETRQDKLAELQLKIENTSEAEANVEFEKLFELEAQLANLVKPKEDKTQQQEDTAKPKSKKEKKSKDKKNVRANQKASKYSDSLTDREIELIENHFHKTKERPCKTHLYVSTETSEPHFDFKSTGNFINLKPNTHSSVTILSGEPELIIKRKLEGPKTGKKDEKKSGATKKTEDNEKECDDKQYITQYNIHVGKYCVKSIILICTIKC